MGCDFKDWVEFIIAFIVSIHAPTWDATLKPCLSYDRESCFNPRTHMGCDFMYGTERII